MNEFPKPHSSTSASDKLVILDTTLRDGEQSPGAAMTVRQKIAVAEYLDALNVDVIEAGFAASSDGDHDAIREISGQVKGSVICSLARANERDIERAANALRSARRSASTPLSPRRRCTWRRSCA